jgi:hypothetical protein
LCGPPHPPDPPYAARISENVGSAANDSATGRPSSFFHDVHTLDERDHLVECVAAAHALAAHAAVGRKHQPLGRDVLQGKARHGGHLVRRLHLEGVVIDGADDDFLLGDRLAHVFEVPWR